MQLTQVLAFGVAFLGLAMAAPAPVAEPVAAPAPYAEPAPVPGGRWRWKPTKSWKSGAYRRKSYKKKKKHSKE